MKFFRRKKKDQSDARQYYRRAPGSKQVLTARMLPVGHQEWIPIEIQDTSAGGAAFVVLKDRDPQLEVGGSLVLSFGSLRHSGEVMAQSEVRLRTEEGEFVRYGCAFQDPSNLLVGLDPYFLKFFNRRRYKRVRPDLGRELNADIRAGEGGWRLRIRDIGPEGISVMVGSEELPWIQQNDRYDIEFRIPKSDMTYMRYARRVHVTQVSGSIRAGLHFEEPEGGPGVEQDQLMKWITDREAAMKQWDKGFD